MAEEGREQNLVHCKMCIRNNITHGKYVTEAQPYTWCLTGHTKTTQKYNIDNKNSSEYFLGSIIYFYRQIGRESFLWINIFYIYFLFLPLTRHLNMICIHSC